MERLDGLADATAAGLLIEAIREPKAPDTLVAGQPGEQRWQRIPLALQLRAVKP